MNNFFDINQSSYLSESHSPLFFYDDDKPDVSSLPMYEFINQENTINIFPQSLNCYQQANDREKNIDEINCFKSEQPEKFKNNSEENITQKQTSVTNENFINSSLNNIQKSQNRTSENLNKVENSSNLNELNKKNNSEISFKDFEFISYEKISQKFRDNVKLKDIINNLNYLKGQMSNTENIQKNLEKNDRKNLTGRKRKNEIQIIKKIENNKTKRGRKIQGDNNPNEHTKMKGDNLMYKIRAYLDNWLLDLINNYLPETKKLMKIKFKIFTKIINRNENIKFLEMTLAEIFSQEISEVYAKKNEKKDLVNYNKKIIEEIMNSEDKIYKKAKALLKITYKDGLDLYRFKENETNLKKILDNEKIDGIEERVDKFISETYEKEKKENGENKAYDFISSLLVMVYNYERWFLLKVPRKKREKMTKDEEIKII